jgi:16S rRNA (guanine527-N7)-methyltransferase
MGDRDLQDGLARLGLDCSAEQAEKLLQYIDLLQKWNKIYNLTAISGKQKMLSYHVLDSLSIAQQIPANASCLDVGTGAGLPGIPLAILLPGTQWVLLDSNGKKTRFVQQVIASCALSNVKVVQCRVEDYHAESHFDVIVSRAYAAIADFTTSVQHLWQPGTQLMSMKTQLSAAERQALDASQYDLEILPLQVPGISESRSLVTIKRQES